MAATKVKPGQQVNGTLFEYVIIYGKTVSALEVVQSVRTTHSQLHASVFCSYFWCILVPLPVGRQLSIHNAEWQASRYVQATSISLHAASMRLNPYPTAFPYGNGMVLHFYQQQESSTTKTVHKVINKGLKAYV